MVDLEVPRIVMLDGADAADLALALRTQRAHPGPIGLACRRWRIDAAFLR